MMPLQDAVWIHLKISGIAAVVGVIIFVLKNHPGTKRSRWQGYWILGCAMLFYQGCTGVNLVSRIPENTAHAYDLAIPLWGLFGGMIVGAIAGVKSGRVMFGERDSSTETDGNSEPE